MIPAPTACAVVALRIMLLRDGMIARRPRLGQVAAEGARLATHNVAVFARAAIKTLVVGCARDVAPLPFILPVALTLVDTLQASVVGALCALSG